MLDRHTVVAVIGASGSGKSSVVKAGVVPELRKRIAPGWRGLVMRPGTDPLLALARALGSEVDLDADEDTRIVRARERAESLLAGKAKLSDYIARIADLRAHGAVAPRLLLFIDQWEELYTQTHSAAARNAFLEHLVETFRSGPHRLIFTMRADFTGHLLESDRRFADCASSGTMLLARMTRDELSRAVRKPAEAVGFTLEEKLVEAILDDAGEEPGVLALVEFSLTELWKDRDQQAKSLTLAAYATLGGLKGAIDRHANEVFAKLQPEQQNAARRALTRLVHVSTLESYTRLRRPLAEFDKPGLDVIQALAQEANRLVVISRDESRQQDVAEVAHEALIREWGKLHDWVAADPAFLQWQESVERRMRRYDEKGQRDEDLLRGTDLEEAQSWRITRTNDIPDKISAFVAASQVQKEKQAADAAKATEDKAAAAQRFKKWSLAFAAVLGAFAIALGISAFSLNSARTDADSKAKAALVNQTRAFSALAQQALSVGRSTEALKLSLGAWPKDDTDNKPQLEKTIRSMSIANSYQKVPSRIIKLGISDAVQISRTEILIASGEKVSLMNTNTDKYIWTADFTRQKGPFSNPLSSVVMSLLPNGDIAHSIAGDISILDRGTGKIKFQNFSRNGSTVGLTPDGDIYRVGLNEYELLDGKGIARIGLVSVIDGKIEKVLPISGRRVALFIVSNSSSEPDFIAVFDAISGHRIGNTFSSEYYGDLTPSVQISDSAIAFYYDNQIRFWDFTTARLLGDPGEMAHDRDVRGVINLSNGNVVSWGDDGIIKVWDGITGRHLGTDMSQDGGVIGVMPLPSGGLLSWSKLGTMRIWDLRKRAQVGKEMHHPGLIISASVTADDRILSWSADGSVRLWDLQTGLETSPPMYHDGAVIGAGVFSGDRVISWSQDSTIRFWKVDEARVRQLESQHVRPIKEILRVGEGAVLSWSSDGIMCVWNSNDGNLERCIRSGGVLKSVKVVGSDYVLTLAARSAAVWRISDGIKIWEWMPERPIKDEILMDENRLALISSNQISILDVKTGKPLIEKEFRPMRTGGQADSDVSWAAKAILLQSGLISIWSRDFVAIFDDSSGQLHPLLDVKDPSEANEILNVVEIGDGRLLVAASNLLAAYDCSNGKIIWEKDPGNDDDIVYSGIFSTAIAKLSTDLFMISDGGDVQIREVGSGGLRKKFTKGLSFGDNYMLLPESGGLLIWGDDGVLEKYDYLKDSVSWVSNLESEIQNVFLLDEILLVNFSDDTWNFVSLKTGRQIGIRNLGSPVAAHALSNDRIVTAIEDRFQIWDVSTASQVGGNIFTPKRLNEKRILFLNDGAIFFGPYTFNYVKFKYDSGNLFQISCKMIDRNNSEDVKYLYSVGVDLAICENAGQAPLPDWRVIERDPIESISDQMVSGRFRHG
ncbi:hypothetical protein EJ071_09370 [Mesorhizobium sp. M1B.F.Ca.ET.045.04.1.1]|nr:PQQ-binding-like beta-propeller repeat protein [Mesorhizobium sp. M1B.F.Ca.ET.045.04.1.1]AZO27609.1 hypothetical protein EJ071_09370 [Mesorhizobium sp. M1B.F.Ca.ET.045.04.1.1]